MTLPGDGPRLAAIRGLRVKNCQEAQRQAAFGVVQAVVFLTRRVTEMGELSYISVKKRASCIGLTF